MGNRIIALFFTTMLTLLILAISNFAWGQREIIRQEAKGDYPAPCVETAPAGETKSSACVQVCQQKLRQGTAHCDAAFLVHGDTRQHSDCLKTVRWNFDACLQACGVTPAWQRCGFVRLKPEQWGKIKALTGSDKARLATVLDCRLVNCKKICVSGCDPPDPHGTITGCSSCYSWYYECDLVCKEK